MFRDDDTIVALATPPGCGALAIIRVSGRGAADLAGAVFCAGHKPQPRVARVGELVHPDSGEVVDHAVCILYRAPYSYTGEDMAELTVHAGPAVVEGALAACYAAGARPAEPGEFTWRALRHGKMDLSAAQAVADLTEARTAHARADALRRLSGELSHKINAIRENVIKARALVEGALEFGEEVAAADVSAAAGAAAQEARDLVRASRERAALFTGVTVAIAGPPNVGKSTLFNRLLGEDRAIVTATPGTTRDRLEAPYIAGGFLFRLCDGAGVRDDAGVDEAEAEGIRRARAQLEEAAVVIWLHDGSRPYTGEVPPVDPERLVAAVNKCDLPLAAGWDELIGSHRALPISAKTGAGVEGLVSILVSRAKGFPGDETKLTLSPRERRLLEEAAASLARAAGDVKTRGVDELVAEELRVAADALGRVTGAVDIEEVYDEVFKRFCVGK